MKLTDNERWLLREMAPGGWYTAHSIDPEAQGEPGEGSSPWVKEALYSLFNRGLVQRMDRHVTIRDKDGTWHRQSGAYKYSLTEEGVEEHNSEIMRSPINL